MVHGILQFTPSIAFRYVLHRCESRDIRCRESFCVFTTKWARLRRTHTANGGATTDGHLFIPIPWRNSRRGLFVLPRGHGFPCHRDREGTGRNEATTPPPVDVC
ncbi:hypothetical protein V6N13_019169 [Hibiscus sabdariffa]